MIEDGSGASWNYLATINPGLEYFPADIDWEDYKRGVEELVRQLSEQFQIRFTLANWGTVQDATFSGSISLPAELLKNASLVRPSIRISNFAKLTTITCEHKVATDKLEDLVGVIRANGFTYVPAAVFGESFETRERHNGDLFNQLFDYV